MFPNEISVQFALDGTFFSLQKKKVKKQIMMHIFLGLNGKGIEKLNKGKNVKKSEEGFESVKIYNVDLQKVLETPKSVAGLIFYKCKLVIYNLTLYNLNSREGT